MSDIPCDLDRDPHWDEESPDHANEAHDEDEAYSPCRGRNLMARHRRSVPCWEDRADDEDHGYA